MHHAIPSFMFLNKILCIQGTINVASTYDSRTRNVESSLVARGDLWRVEASQGSSTSGNENSSLFLVQLGPVLFVRDSTLLLPVHLSKQHLLWYGYDRKVWQTYQSIISFWFVLSMIDIWCLVTIWRKGTWKMDVVELNLHYVVFRWWLPQILNITQQSPIVWLLFLPCYWNSIHEGHYSCVLFWKLNRFSGLCCTEWNAFSLSSCVVKA